MPSNNDIALNYPTQTDVTASNVFSPEQVGTIELTGALVAVIQAAKEMDKFKKALFRKRTREESMLPPLDPNDPTLPTAIGDDVLAIMEFEGLFHGIIGNITEVGEQAEILYVLLTENGSEVDMANVREEIGDNLWYLARLVKFAKTSFPAEMEANIEKLRLRHGTAGFSKEGDMNRDTTAEHAIFEGNDDLEHPLEGMADHPDTVQD